MPKTIRKTRANDATLGRLYRERDELDRELKAVSARISDVEIRSARPLLVGDPPAPAPELPDLVKERQRLFDALRLNRLAIDMARGRI